MRMHRIVRLDAHTTVFTTPPHSKCEHARSRMDRRMHMAAQAALLLTSLAGVEAGPALSSMVSGMSDNVRGDLTEQGAFKLAGVAVAKVVVLYCSRINSRLGPCSPRVLLALLQFSTKWLPPSLLAVSTSSTSADAVNHMSAGCLHRAC